MRIAASAESPNEKPGLGIAGVAGRGAGNIAGVQGERIVALCDIDEKNLYEVSQRFKTARVYNDYRKMLDQKDVDAVAVSTPDHVHAFATMAALRAGKHVYCEKPLTHSMWEAHKVTAMPTEKRAATQMGTQSHAGDDCRRAVEVIRSGAIGDVREAHAWVGRVWSGGERPRETMQVPAHTKAHQVRPPARAGSGTPLPQRLPAEEPARLVGLRRRHPRRHGLPLPRPHPLGPRPREPDRRRGRRAARPARDDARTGPRPLYRHPARGSLPPVTVTWHHGGKRPPQFAEGKLTDRGDGVLFVGDGGMLPASYGSYRLFPEERSRDFTPPPESIPKSIGHHSEWIAACKTGAPTTCNLRYSGPLTETVLLGNVPYRAGGKIAWERHRLSTGDPEADRFLRREYRRGWTL